MFARLSMLLLCLLALVPGVRAEARSALVEAAREAAVALPAGGVVVGVQQRGEAPQVHAFGDLEVAAGDVPAGELVFEIGSISKLFTGLLLGQAVVDGKLALDDTLGDVLGDALADATAPVQGITLEQLATHRSCLPRLPDDLAPANPADPYPGYDRERLLALLQRLELPATPPCDPDYSNVGFGVLGLVLEHAYGRSWAELIEEKIAAPAGMVDTVQMLDEKQARRFVAAHAGASEVAPWTFKAMAAAGALRSTAADLLRLGMALLDPDHALAPAWKLASTMRADYPALGGRMGLAVFETSNDDGTYLWHNGGTGGFRSELRVYPDAGRAEVLLVSNSGLAPSAIYAALESADGSAHAKGAAAAKAAPMPIEAQKLAELAGVYKVDSNVAFTVVLRDGQPWVRLTGQTFLPVVHVGNERFSYEAVAAELQFERDAGGKVSELVLFQGGRELHAERSDDPVPAIRFPDAATLQEYAGTYTLAPGAVFTITVRGGTLFAQLTGQQALPVFAVGGERFDYDVVPASLQFERGEDGKVDALVLHQNGVQQRAAKSP